MEQNRFGGNNKLFLFGMLCLTISLGLLFFSLYILPYLIWEWNYDVPEFILDLLAMYQDHYRYTSVNSKIIVWLIFFIPCLITGFVSYLVSQYFDKKMYGTDSELDLEENQEKTEGELQKQIKESASLGGKILGLMVVIVILVFLLQYFVQSTA